MNRKTPTWKMICVRVWRQPGAPSESLRPHRKFVRNSTSSAKEKYTHHWKFSEREAPFWIKIKASLYHRDIRGSRTLPF